MQSAKLKGAQFKELVSAVTKFPSVGTFVGSDIVSLRVANGKLTASSFGVVLSYASVEAEGTVDLFGIDERALGQFASHCRSNSDVRITRDKSGVKLRRGSTTEVLTGLVKGVRYERAKTNGNGFKVDWNAAKNIQYLSGLAMSDTSKPELNCVLLQNYKAVACGQKVTASIDCRITKDRHALPLPLLKVLGKDDTLYPGDKQTVLESGIARYEMPAPTKAQEKFPYAAVEKYRKGEAEKIAVISGSKLKLAIEECNSCVAGISRLEVIMKLSFRNNKLEISAENGGVKFRKVLPARVMVESSVSVALAESVQASLLYEGKDVTVTTGTGSMFLNFQGGWLLFSTWSK